ncbi:hypothetical protein IGI04_012344 [Brassica rapa subsp. trilocularis]|uniref:Uncharacterized protein n=1 Tax=Brassica rapa subsp. trilocularis TaxID=1813537 RepID=A0ABQ7N822_BRACM|nr:hypothetical protein IGI04_012344 [Brassica rapa subsp. trilocularis]
MDAPERCERFVVPEGTKKQLQRDENVVCFWMPTSSSSHVQNHSQGVRTTNQSSPMQAYNQAINDLDKELDTLKNQFEAEMAKFSDH